MRQKALDIEEFEHLIILALNFIKNSDCNALLMNI